MSLNTLGFKQMNELWSNPSRRQTKRGISGMCSLEVFRWCLLHNRKIDVSSRSIVLQIKFILRRWKQLPCANNRNQTHGLYDQNLHTPSFAELGVYRFNKECTTYFFFYHVYFKGREEAHTGRRPRPLTPCKAFTSEGRTKSWCRRKKDDKQML